ncbi:MAG: hypothetical protein ACRD0C_07175 [Acidimicrobiia bacterium]
MTAVLARAARRSGLPEWALATLGVGLVAQALTVTAVAWDVAWHVDSGRDPSQITPVHLFILAALGLIVAAGLAGMSVANASGFEAGLRFRNLALPWSAVLVLLGGFAAFAGMPLDELWHRNYGVDLTMWGPTHLLMIGGGNLAALGLWMVLAEARVPARGWGWLAHFAAACCMLAQLHVFQGEFDFGVPLFQLLYQPVLTVIAAGVVLVAARVVLGRGGALAVAAGYLGFRLLLAGFVGGVLDHTTPYVPLHLASAVAVEGVAAMLGTGRRLRFGAAAGLAVATVGLAGERMWVNAFAPHRWGGGLVPELFVVGGLAALGAGLLGAGLGGLAGRTAALPAGALATGAAAVVLALAVPFPRTAGNVDAEMRLERQDGRAAIELRLTPPGAAAGARWFEAFAWQGGGVVRAGMEPAGPGRWRSRGTVPVTGRWKTVVRLHRGSDLMAFPVYAPADPAIHAPAVPALALRRVAGTADADVLLREVHPGPAWPAAVAWAGIAAMVSAWAVAIGAAGRLHRSSCMRASTPARIPGMPIA